MKRTNCFYNLQFGFHPNLSTSNALLFIIENTQTNLDNWNFAGGVFNDFKKGFDTVIINSLNFLYETKTDAN